MKSTKFITFFLTLSSLFIVLFTGCATVQTWGTYKTEGSYKSNLGGKAEVHGTIRMTEKLNDIVYNNIHHKSADTWGIKTKVTIDSTGKETESDEHGNFNFTDLIPGQYSIIFTDGNNKTKRANILLSSNQSLGLVIYVQRDEYFGTEGKPYPEPHGNGW